MYKYGLSIMWFINATVDEYFNVIYFSVGISEHDVFWRYGYNGSPTECTNLNTSVSKFLLIATTFDGWHLKSASAAVTRFRCAATDARFS